MAVEEIARLAGHSSSRTTEVVYRHELRPVITTGADAMDKMFDRMMGARVDHAALCASASSIATYSASAVAVMNRALPSFTECSRPERIRS
jgi:hypothetical protein